MQSTLKLLNLNDGTDFILMKMMRNDAKTLHEILSPPRPGTPGRGGGGGRGETGPIPRISVRFQGSRPLIPSPSPRSTGEKGASIHSSKEISFQIPHVSSAKTFSLAQGWRGLMKMMRNDPKTLHEILSPPRPGTPGRGGWGVRGETGPIPKLSLRFQRSRPLIPSPSSRSTGEKLLLAMK